VEYLQAAKLTIPPLLATALYYALISETQHLGRDVTNRDIRASTFLFPLVRHRLISRIEHPAHSREFFQQLYSSLGKTFTYKSFVGARLGEIYYPSFVAELADMLVSLKRATWCCVVGRYRKHSISRCEQPIPGHGLANFCEKLSGNGEAPAGMR